MTDTTDRPDAGLATMTLGQLLAHPFQRREHLVFPWLRQGESAMLWAAPGIGKTMLSLTLALAVAGGGEVLGWSSPSPRRVLLVDGEMAGEDLRDRVAMLARTIAGFDAEAANANLRVLVRQMQPGEAPFPDLAKAEGQMEVLRLAKEHNADLLILDNYSTLAEVADENDAAAMTPVLSYLLRLKQERIACLLVHHSGKSGSTYRGSSKLATSFEVILGLTRKEGVSVPAGIAFQLEWTKYRGAPCEEVRDRDIRLVRGADDAPSWVAERAQSDDMAALLEVVRSGVHGSQRAVAAALGWDPAKVTRTKAQAIGLGHITRAEWDEYLRCSRSSDETGAY